MTAFNFTSSSALYSLARDLHDDIIVYTHVILTFITLKYCVMKTMSMNIKVNRN